MYVKVMPSHTPQFTLYATVGSIKFGRHWSDDNPEIRKYQAELDVRIDELRIDGIVDEATNDPIEGEPGQWRYSYAWWVDHDHYVMGVVTSGSLYIVGDNGKTIDKA